MSNFLKDMQAARGDAGDVEDLDKDDVDPQM
jgi:hypothetical protein